MKTSVLSTIFLAALAGALPLLEVGELESGRRLLRRQGKLGGLGGCKAVTVIWSRGTSEPGGDVGTLVGRPFANALSKVLPGQVDFEGVNYSAGVVGYLIGGDPAGAATMAKQVTTVVSKCPNTKLVLGGYR
jgi:hypothetical protein